jgi:HAD superfamily hydrolase (TIGR01490 family)
MTVSALRPAAFFDMDRTLIRCNTGTLWLKFLRRRQEISIGRYLRGFGWVARYKLALLDMEAITRLASAELAGEPEAEMIEKCRVFFESQVRPHVAPLAIEAIRRHRQDGHVLAILTSSTRYISEQLAGELQIDHVLCTRLGIRDGKFDGTHVAPACYGDGKVHWAEGFAAEHGVDLARSYFYTDSYSDLPMLERVGAARVVNPDARLSRHARRVGWSVERW